MPLTTSIDAFPDALPRPAAAPSRLPAKRNVLLRIVDALAASNRRKAEREIARYVARHGGALTDRLEHDIVQRYGRPR